MGPTVALRDAVISPPPVSGGPVLVAVTPTARAGAALTMATWVAKRLHRELHVLTVTETPEMTGTAEGAPVSLAFSVRERNRITAQWRSFLDRGLPESLVARLDVIPGSIAATVAETAAARGASLIVVSARPNTMVGRFIHADHALAIANRSIQPVLIVPPTALPPLHRAMIATDFTSTDVHSMELVAMLVAPEDRMTLAHLRVSTRVDRDPRDDGATLVQRRGNVEAMQRKRLLGELPDAVRSRIDTVVLPRDGFAALVAYAQQMSADLVACRRRRRSHWLDLFALRTSTMLIRRSNCPVLVVPR